MSRADAAPVFAALGDPTRLELVSRLCTGPQSIAQLTANAAVTRQAVTKHLEVLAGVGLVRDAWRGRERIFELEPRRLDDARLFLEQISRRWDAALLRLRGRFGLGSRRGCGDGRAPADEHQEGQEEVSSHFRVHALGLLPCIADSTPYSSRGLFSARC